MQPRLRLYLLSSFGQAVHLFVPQLYTHAFHVEPHPSISVGLDSLPHARTPSSAPPTYLSLKLNNINRSQLSEPRHRSSESVAAPSIPLEGRQYKTPCEQKRVIMYEKSNIYQESNPHHTTPQTRQDVSVRTKPQLSQNLPSTCTCHSQASISR